MIAIIDYGLGNLFSVRNALNHLGAPNVITADAREIARADGLLLPGVGAFGEGMRRLNESGLAGVIREQAAIKPLLGVCLGMQLLFDKSYEFGEHAGLGLLPGEVVRIEGDIRVPHIGWNGTHLLGHPLTAGFTDGLDDGVCFYFVHSYKALPDRADLIATADYAQEIAAIVGRGRIFGTQFHPEKSGEAGLTLLKNFWRMTT